MSDADSESSTVELSPEVYARVESRVQNSEFDDTATYVEFVLVELLDRLKDDSDGMENNEEVRERLRELGYLE